MLWGERILDRRMETWILGSNPLSSLHLGFLIGKAVVAVGGATWPRRVLPSLALNVSGPRTHLASASQALEVGCCCPETQFQVRLSPTHQVLGSEWA